MSHLPKRTQDLFAVARSVDGPTRAERERMRRAIGRRAALIAAGVTVSAVGAETAAQAGTGAGLAGGASGAGAIGTAGVTGTAGIVGTAGAAGTIGVAGGAGGAGVAGVAIGSGGLVAKVVLPLVLVGALGGGGIAALRSPRTAARPAPPVAAAVSNDASRRPMAATRPSAVPSTLDPITRPLDPPPSVDTATTAPALAPTNAVEHATAGEPRSIGPLRVAPMRAEGARSEAGRSRVVARAGNEPSATLADEIALLDAAQGALRRGDPSAALDALDRSERLYPRAILDEERAGERVVALCAAGRGREAAPLAARFRAAHPSSPLVARIAATCSGTASDGAAPTE